MTDSQRLLADYVTNGSEQAFRELVTRYLDLVYSTAIRLVGGDAHRAEDVAQTVFVDLARKARTLPSDVMLGGWLHQDTCFVASKIMRGERRRQFRERQAVEMNALQDHSEANLAQVAPILDEAINQLGAEDRTAILLRFFEQRNLRSIGEALGSTEDAAQKRLTRALEELRVLLKHRGVALSAAALGTALASEAVSAAPVGLAVTVSSVALASAAAGTGTTFTFLKAMTMTKLQAGIIGAIIVASVLTPLLIEQQAQVKLREENQSLRQQIAQLKADNKSLSDRAIHVKGARAPRLPAPPMQVTNPPSALATEDLQPTNLYLYARLDKPPKLTAEQVESYLKANRRNAASLLAAYRTTGNPALLEEAMQKYPNDPQVDFEAVFKNDATPEERRQWLDAFKQSAPDNALANYLSAFSYFKAGQTDQAVQEFIAASDKPQFQDYRLDRYQDDEEAYLTAGYSVAEANVLASEQLLLPFLSPLKVEVRDYLVPLANSYRQVGDEESAQAALQMGVNLGQRFDVDGPAGQFVLNNLVGMAIQRIVLGAMDPNSPYGNGQTVQDQLNQIAQQEAALRKLGQQTEPLLRTMSDQDWISYTDRKMAFGGEAANRWLVNKYGQK
ncbi:MAG: sigma-70 family RNA polymerase sigma factor [Verrucomicrobiia bacterium]|jgi:RNA polymerase sigma factor (sigma-70 family)